MARVLKHWWQRRTAKDAPSHLADQAMTKEGAWATGWNECVQAYHAEVNETLRREGQVREDW